MLIYIFIAILAVCLILAMLSFTPFVQARIAWLTHFRTYMLFGILLGIVLCVAGFMIAKAISASYMPTFSG